MTTVTEGVRATKEQFHTLRVAGVEALTDDSAAVTFEVPPELRDTFSFAAGESLTFRRQVGGVEERRTYSICAPVGRALRIGVREIPDGLFSGWLARGVRPGDAVEVQAPAGGFRTEVGENQRHLCIAAGSGITPVLSVLTTALAQPGSSATLLYGNRSAASVMFAEELADLKDAHHERFDLVHVLSREPREVDLFSGRLDADRLREVLTRLVPLGDVDHVWLCGPYEMLLAARTVLAELGVAAERVHAELFYVDAPPPPVVHPERVVDGATSRVTIVLDGRESEVAMALDRTVLDSAQEMRSDLPFACKGGVCGTCRARVGEGQVEMVRNFALEEHEVAAGFVLTCQSYPRSDRVRLDFDA